MTLLMTLALYTSAGVWRYGRWFDYSLTGLLIGLAVATKYTAALAGVWLLVAHLALRVARPWFWRRLVMGRLVLAGFLIPVTFLATAPYTLIDWPDFVDAVNKLRAQGTQGINGELFSLHGAWIYYFQALSWGVGWLLLALSLAGLIYALFRRGEGSQANWLLIALPILFYLYMGRQLVYFARYLLPVLPPLLLLAAHFLDDVLTRRSLARCSPKLALAVATVVCLAQPVAAALRFDSLLTRPDTRVDAQAWVDEHITPEDIVAVERYSVDEPNDDYDFIDLKTRGFADKPLSFYSQQQVQYVVMSSFVYQRVKIDPVEQQERSARLQTLFDSAGLVYEVQPFIRQPPAWRYDEITGPAGEVWFRHRPGPIIKIYRLEAGQWDHQ
jgi:hypothetical protein